ncbi:MAG: magnesium transporter [Planctomycetaceae bacterium]|jgi:magnesium transporter|nr:magnesium transporter [Planctomycetaceae bacterium]
MPTNPIYLPELREMIAENNVEEMYEFCKALHPAQTVEFMDGLEPVEIWAILRHAEKPVAAEIFSYFDEDIQVRIVESAPRDEIADLIEHLPSDDRVDILQSTDKDVVAELMPLMEAEDRSDIQRLSAFADGTCGAEMTTDFVRLRANMTITEALQEIGRQTEEIETVYYLYVVNEADHLVGLVSAKQLLHNLSRPHTLIRDLMKRDLITVRADEDREVAAREVAKFDFLAIPVVDANRHMLGIITHDDIMDMVQDEATEDAYRMAAIGPMEESYLNAPFWTIWKSRVMWLSLLFAAELATFTVMAHFDAELSTVKVLALFIPLVISTGGNSGSQAATLITRALALGEVRMRDVLRVLRHELLMGLALGVSLGAIGFLRAFLTPDHILSGTNRSLLSVTICLTASLICLFGTVVGAMLPLGFKRLGFDPGMASSPFVATFVDVVGIFIFFTVARIFLI